MKTMAVNEFQKIISEDNVFLLDVRMNQEFDFANIGGTLIPLDQLEARVSEVPKDKDIYCLCHHGVRSMHAANFLMSLGYENVWNIEGGIHAWSTQVDPSVAQY